MENVMLWAGAGQIGMAIARRMGAGMKIVVGDKKWANAQAIAKTMNEAGFDVVPVEMGLSSRESIRNLIAKGQKYGEIKMLVNAADVSPSQAPVAALRRRADQFHLVEKTPPNAAAAGPARKSATLPPRHGVDKHAFPPAETAASAHGISRRKHSSLRSRSADGRQLGTVRPWTSPSDACRRFSNRT